MGQNDCRIVYPHYSGDVGKRFNRDGYSGRMFDGWDDVVPTSKCLHCNGTGKAPGEGSTECGFCD